MTQNKTAITPFTFTLEDDDGEEVEHSLPAKLELCDNCGGEGKIVDPDMAMSTHWTLRVISVSVIVFLYLYR
jgi:hypothetical protein